MISNNAVGRPVTSDELAAWEAEYGTSDDIDATRIVRLIAALRESEAMVVRLWPSDVEVVDWRGHGCGSHSCAIEKPKGMGVNGPCRCFDALDREAAMRLNRGVLFLRQQIAMAEAKSAAKYLNEHRLRTDAEDRAARLEAALPELRIAIREYASAHTRAAVHSSGSVADLIVDKAQARLDAALAALTAGDAQEGGQADGRD